MKHYDSFENVKYDKYLIGEEVWAFNKLDGQNFCVKYSPKIKDFVMFGSKTQNVDETSEQFGDAVCFFKDNLAEKCKEIILANSKKKGVFQGITEITLFFEWVGENSFCGKHIEGEELELVLIDVFLKKKGYIEPKTYYKLFKGEIPIPELIYRGKLTKDFILSIKNNDFNKSDCEFPNIREGVVCKRSTLLKGQRLPKVKVKTDWWLSELKKLYPDDWISLE